MASIQHQRKVTSESHSVSDGLGYAREKKPQYKYAALKNKEKGTKMPGDVKTETLNLMYCFDCDRNIGVGYKGEPFAGSLNTSHSKSSNVSVACVELVKNKWRVWMIESAACSLKILFSLSGSSLSKSFRAEPQLSDASDHAGRWSPADVAWLRSEFCGPLTSASYS